MEIQAEGSSYKCSFTRMYLLDTWCSVEGTSAEKLRHTLHVVTQTLPDVENLDIVNLTKRITYICEKLTKFWKLSARVKSRLCAKHSDWLHVTEECVISRAERNTRNQENQEEKQEPSSSKHYRKDFADCSSRNQRRRLASLSDVDKSAVNFLLNKSDCSNTSFSQLSADEVVSLITEAKLTKHQYLLIKNFINSKVSNDLFPSYQKVLSAKKRCYPSEENITESCAEVDLQSLLNHTASRILESQKDVLDSISPGLLDNGSIELIGKWGFDGSTGHSEYKQSFLDSSIGDSSLFVSSYVPLQLICKSATSDSEPIIVWKNPRPSSTRFCRPIRFQFQKETSELSVQEELYITNKINNLCPTSFVFNDREIKIQHSLQLTMVDGKVCCALSETSSSRCYICNATPKEMNNIESSLMKPVDSTNYRFGLSPLHSWIRFFEYFIHLSYRLHIQKWQIRSEEDKVLFAQRKTDIQKQFREKLGLIVDKPRSGGSGNSNDGNTARKFFSNSSTSSEITGIDKVLIDRCHHILICLASGYKINVQKFKEYALQTAHKLVQAFPCYNLPASVHKILIHGSEVIDNSVLPIGELSEEAAESCNKLLKLFRRDNTRKMSRVLTNTDLLHRLLLNSDPYISSLRKLPFKKKSVLPKDALDLLQI